ncbi:nucleotidyl transferase AbiEii/AbiGii toxin family protein [Nocardia sp. NPDC058658]|uniref:nucleotidyl transferase AbiEii/AbiGii toxin family protein n=1 Tax=Nocardia sp. NPDC058658 TaxID=3346580 RepID=UPI003650BCB1
MEPHHRRLAGIALGVAGDQGFALAGGYAMRAHGMGDRPSGDVDLFTDWHRRADFPGAVAAVTAALCANGYSVEVTTSGETFARLLVRSLAEPQREPDKLELSADWRAHPPVILDVGPVLHPDDAVANKMIALYGRALPRDFLDVDAAITTGRYTRDGLIELASSADRGFEPMMFADALGALRQITDDAFAEYRVSPEQVTQMRARFRDWRDELIAAASPH